MNKTIIALLLLITTPLYANDTKDPDQVRWPIPDWEVNPSISENMTSPQCNAFVNFATQSKDFLTDGLVVVKDGVIQYEYYDSKYDANKPHILWSISKTITGALLGTAVRDGKINFDQRLSEFYPEPKFASNYEKIKIKNLFYFDSGLKWNEFYAGNLKDSSVVNMLYGKGHLDMAKYTASRGSIPEGPSYTWNYTTGTPTITMDVLKNVYGNDYEEMPWKNLANPLGLKSFVFEKDASGTFNGGAFVHATPRDMAKIGYLYLNDGQWNNETILTKDWIDKTLTVSPGYLSSGTVIHDITDDGVYGGSIWLNRPAKKGFGRPYPVSPEDMYLAMGHYGQLLIVLPTQKIVIARTAYDKEYNSKIDEFVTRAISCFDNPNYPIGKNIPPPKSSKSPLEEMVETLKSGVETNLFQPSVAKTICSCHFIAGIDVKTCLERSNIPLADTLSEIIITENDGQTGVYSVMAPPSWIGQLLGLKDIDLPRAYYDSTHPEFGCTLN